MMGDGDMDQNKVAEGAEGAAPATDPMAPEAPAETPEAPAEGGAVEPPKPEEPAQE